MANANDLIAACVADVNRQPPLKYGNREINGLPQRGPDSYDCIGMVRKWLLQVVPTLWPTSWGGPDSWTVPNFYAAWAAHGKQVTRNQPKKADILIWLDKFGAAQHIGIADGQENTYSALNTIHNICLWPINQVGYPTLLVLPTELENVIVPPNAPIGIARIDTNVNIRGIDVKGVTYQLPLGSDIAVYGEVPLAGGGVVDDGPAYVVLEPGGNVIHLLKRNTTAFWTLGISCPTLQTKIDKAIADLS